MTGWSDYMKVVINRCYGGFGLSKEAKELYNTLRPKSERTDPILVKVVETLKEKANGDCAQLKIVEIPDDVDFVIEEYDGNEWVAEKHRTWS